jgi:hypothetical protein
MTRVQDSPSVAGAVPRRIWDLPLVAHRCYRLRVAPLAIVLRLISVRRMHPAAIPGLVATVDKITALIIVALPLSLALALALALALKTSLHALSSSQHTSLGTKRS